MKFFKFFATIRKKKIKFFEQVIQAVKKLKFFKDQNGLQTSSLYIFQILPTGSRMVFFCEQALQTIQYFKLIPR